MSTTTVGLSPVWKIVLVGVLRAGAEVLTKLADRLED